MLTSVYDRQHQVTRNDMGIISVDQYDQCWNAPLPLTFRIPPRRKNAHGPKAEKFARWPGQTFLFEDGTI